MYYLMDRDIIYNNNNNNNNNSIDPEGIMHV